MRKTFIRLIRITALMIILLSPARIFAGENNPVILRGHTNPVFSVAFSPDGKTLASGSYDDTIRLWEVATGAEIRELTGHTGNVYGVAFSPDGRILASGSYDDTIRLWEVATGVEIRELAGHTGSVHGVAFSPDGRILASGSYDDTIRLWEVATGKEIKELTGHTGSVNGVAFSPDGKTLASGSSDETITLWEADTWKEIRKLTGHFEGISSVTFSPDGQLLASGSYSYERTIRLWEVATGAEIRELTGHTGGVYGVAFSPDGRILASGSEDDTVRLWEVATGEEIRILTDHTGNVNDIIFSPDGELLASGSSDNTVRLWRKGLDANIKPILSEPSNGTTVQDESVTLRWQTVPMAIEYHVQVARDDDFASILVDQHVSKEELVVDVISPVTYWKVQGVGLIEEYTQWSSVWSFGTDAPVVDLEVNSIQGMAINVDVVIDKVNGLYGFQLDVPFDRDLLEAVSVSEGPFLKSAGGSTFWQPPTIDNRNGVIKGILATRTGAGGVNGKGVVASIVFNAERTGTTILMPENVILSDANGGKMFFVTGYAKVEASSSSRLVVQPMIDKGVTLEIRAENVEQLYSFSFELEYNCDLLDVGKDDVKKGPFLEDETDFDSIGVDCWDDRIRGFSWKSGNIEGISGSGVIATVRFRIYESGIAKFRIFDLEMRDASNEDMAALPVDASAEFIVSPAWEINKDYVVDIFDFAILGVQFGRHISTSYPPRPNPDINKDGIVDVLDFVMVGANFGEIYSASKASAAPPLIAETDWRNCDYSKHLPLLLGLYAELEANPVQSEEYIRTRGLMLELIYLGQNGSMILQENELMQNYPNPFNPDTWIPYQLKEDAQVVIKIYTSTGRLVRTLNLGHKPGGYYAEKEKAAYWDGRNEAGERVSSGVYFYTIRAGDYNDTRRMAVIQ